MKQETKAKPLVDVASWLLSGAVWLALFGVSEGLALFVTVLAHEGAHAIAMKRLGIPLKKFRAWVLFAFVEPEVNLAPGRRDFWASLAGPASGIPIAMIGLTGYLAMGLEILLPAAGFAVVLNLLNLLPIGPLDGGRIACAIGRSLKPSRRSAFFVGVVVSAIGVQVLVWGVSGWTASVAIFSALYLFGRGFSRREVMGDESLTWTEDQWDNQVAWDSEAPCGHAASTIWFLVTVTVLLVLATAIYRVAPGGTLPWT